MELVLFQTLPSATKSDHSSLFGPPVDPTWKSGRGETGEANLQDERSQRWDHSSRIRTSPPMGRGHKANMERADPPHVTKDIAMGI